LIRRSTAPLIVYDPQLLDSGQVFLRIVPTIERPDIVIVSPSGHEIDAIAVDVSFATPGALHRKQDIAVISGDELNGPLGTGRGNY
jgi:hypothetical protein